MSRVKPSCCCPCHERIGPRPQPTRKEIEQEAKSVVKDALQKLTPHQITELVNMLRDSVRKGKGEQR